MAALHLAVVILALAGCAAPAAPPHVDVQAGKPALPSSRFRNANTDEAAKCLTSSKKKLYLTSTKIHISLIPG